MRSRIAQYMNEIVSLTIMALMSVALIAGQAGASQQDSAIQAPNVPAVDGNGSGGTGLLIEDGWLVIDEPGLKVDVTFRFRQTGE